ncbi:tripartite motif-containing protein 59-like [Macrobrachium rosenbergii]|uniref:tripartite motif-containing protein 59-like n=1 Tax=Macrobrachium rosenbergii TaxID=79674 RepID=UPI0034D6C500
MASNPLECDICCNVFSEDHCPRILPCSHTFCNPCIDAFILAKKKECPVCRKTFRANSAEHVVINRKLLDAAKKFSSKHVGSKITSTRPKKCFLKTAKYFRENVTKRGIAVCSGAEAEAKDLIDSYREMKKGVEEVILSSEKTLSSIDRNIKLLMNRLEKMQKNKTKFKESDAQIEAATDFISAAPLMQEAEDLLQAMEETMKEFQEDKREECHIKKEILKMKENLDKFVNDTERITEEEEGQETEQEQEEERDPVVNITVADFRSPHGRLRGDAQREIFAVTTYEGKLRVAPVKIESNNQASFTHLQEGVLPPRCFVIELESLMQWSPSPSPSPPPSSPPRAFLDLAYESTHLGRVIIRIIDQGGQLGLNFIQMCSGRTGPSYANSQILDVNNKGRAGEWIQMGDYVTHGGGGGGDGTSTQAVLSSREDWERKSQGKTYKSMQWKEGDVRGFTSYEKASWFGIVTRDHPSWNGKDCFGKVEEGLDVLRDAILKYPDTGKVKIAQCGCYFPL